MNPVLRWGPGHNIEEGLHVYHLLVQPAVHELHAVLLPLVPGKVGQGLDRWIDVQGREKERNA